MNWFLTSKYAIYVTWAFEGSKGACGCYPDGSLPRSIDEMAEKFNLKKFADDCVEFGVQYVNFTAYHAHMNVLFPSKVLDKYIPGHTSSKDFIRELADELHIRGIKLQLYIHATIGDSMTEDERAALGWYDKYNGYKVWNDFINEFFNELCSRYGEDIDSYYIDMVFHEPFVEMIDRLRLEKTLRSYHPGTVIVGNGQAIVGLDHGSREDAMIYYENADERPAYPTQTVVCLTGTWWSKNPEDAPSAVRYTPEHLFRYLILTISANTEGGGLALGVSPYITNGYEPGVRDALIRLRELIEPVAESIYDTIPSAAFVTPAGMRIKDLPYGFVVVRSKDQAKDYLHVLAAPESNAIRIPKPLDGSVYVRAYLLRSGGEAEISMQSAGGVITIREDWDPLDTVIVLIRKEGDNKYFDNKGKILPPDNIKVIGDGHAEKHGPENLLDNDPETYWCTGAGITHSLIFDLGCEYDLCALRVIPRQDNSVESLITHITSFAVWAGLSKTEMTPVATGEWHRGSVENRISFPSVKARFVRLDAGPEWLPDDWRIYPRSAASACAVKFEVK